MIKVRSRKGGINVVGNMIEFGRTDDEFFANRTRMNFDAVLRAIDFVVDKNITITDTKTNITSQLSGDSVSKDLMMVLYK